LDSATIAKEPEVPKNILQSANDGKLCFFLGAGISRLLGCKGWKDVANNLVEKCFELKCVNFRQKESISVINDPKKIITVCFNILCSKGHNDVFFNQIEQCLHANASLLETQNIYRVLSDLPAVLPALYLTTNIDVNFDSAFQGSVFCEENDFSPDNIFPDKLYKIHGSIERRNSIIFTVPQYLARYRNPNFGAFLTQIFSSYSIIFLGYGLEEFEILDFLVTKMGKGMVGLNHCILLPYYQGENYLLDFDTDYFKPLGIQVVGYEKDQNGYAQLYNVVKKWKKDLTELTDVQHESVKTMEEVVDTL
jgi:hypothetical protein